MSTGQFQGINLDKQPQRHVSQGPWKNLASSSIWLLPLALGTAFLSPLPVHADLAPPPAARTTFEIENNALKVPSPLAFETGSAKLKPESDAALQHVKAYLTEKSYITLMRIEGHIAAGGDEAANQTLSEQRAKAAAEWLVSHGVDCKRLLPVGFGSNKPVAANDSPEGRAANTRLVFANAALRDRAIGGMPTDGGGRVVTAWKCP